ncbi:MAG: 4-(cytidine 5'-diphospho)-2-C-methyl-D-erythritol kinase [Lachnospiraceae bacterium]|nr:4-(cytidine 5'-diphospho)-2-C-methyl-D-erythritol kinase [Lachnospiraceae bacterium]
MIPMKILAMSKINLGLDVLRRREDGYHEVRMIMQTLSLHDELVFEKRDDDEIRIICDNAGLECNEDNLIYKAARMIMDEAGVSCGFDIKLTKNIPIAAGMAGGSTDAAATFTAINEILGLGYSKQKLREMGVKLGADIPYCIEGGTKLSEGIGEKLTDLKPAPKCHVVVVKPHIGVSTGYVYENLHVENITKHPDIDGMLDAIERGDFRDMAAKMDNILENVTEKQYPVIAELKTIMKENGAANAIMSGSGPTVFGLFEDRTRAEVALKKLMDTGEVSRGSVTEFVDSSCVIC